MFHFFSCYFFYFFCPGLVRTFPQQNNMGQYITRIDETWCTIYQWFIQPKPYSPLNLYRRKYTTGMCISFTHHFISVFCPLVAFEIWCVLSIYNDSIYYGVLKMDQNVKCKIKTSYWNKLFGNGQPIFFFTSLLKLEYPNWICFDVFFNNIIK